MIDNHICSLDGEECNTEDCNSCQKEIDKKQKNPEPIQDFLHRAQDDLSQYCFENHPEKMDTKCADCDLLGRC